MVQPLSEDDLTTPEGRCAANYRRLRLRAGYATQKQLAEHLGMVQKAISYWELGVQRPGSLTMEFKVADAFGVDVTELVGNWMRSDDPEDWPIDLEVYHMLRDVKYVALEVVKSLPSNKPAVCRFVQDVLVFDQKPGPVPAKVKAEAIEAVQASLPKRMDPRIARYLLRKLREA